MENNKLAKLMRKKKIDINDFDSEDMSTLLGHYLKDGFSTEELTAYLKEANLGYEAFINGLDSFIEKGNYSSKKYTDALQSLVDDLRVRIKEAKTVEEDERIWVNINNLLDRMKEEADRETDLINNLSKIAAGVGVIVIGGAVAIATKNPDLLKKGIEMIPTKIDRL